MKDTYLSAVAMEAIAYHLTQAFVNLKDLLEPGLENWDPIQLIENINNHLDEIHSRLGLKEKKDGQS